MHKTIELPLNIFARLEKHASGFDTPANVITNLLDFYENVPVTSNSIASDESIVMQAFRLNFDIEPRPFGQKGDAVSGYSDGRKGLQWNIVVNSDTGVISLGVNLEGMKYKDWPITNLLLNERKHAKLLGLCDIERASEIQVRMSRDAWQAAARPLIKERHIAPANLFLSELNKTLWSDIINESLGCLNKSADYKGRGTQTVSRIKSNDTKKMEVSPHLSFRLFITDSEPHSLDLFLKDLKDAQSALMPLYNFVTEQIK
jgi:hypothetical protein